MLTAISRYGARVIPNTEQTVAALEKQGRLIEGPEIAAFEQAFARRLGLTRATSASFGRMAFYYLLKALELPKGSEIIFPALTFWVVPELARVAGLVPVFADIDPRTYTIDPDAFERAITPRTSAVVPTHLYGLTCDMEAVMRIARRHNLAVIEDCAHALGARFRGQPAGTFGHGAFFSFQTLKPLNTYGGGIAVARDPDVQQRVADLAAAEPWPSRERVTKRLQLGRAQRVLIRPRVFTWTLFPLLWGASFVTGNPDVYLWEKIRLALAAAGAVSPSGTRTRRRPSGSKRSRSLDTWTTATQKHAQQLDATLSGTAGVQTPFVPEGYEHVYYQYLRRGAGPRRRHPPCDSSRRGRREPARRRVPVARAVRRARIRRALPGRPAGGRIGATAGLRGAVRGRSVEGRAHAAACRGADAPAEAGAVTCLTCGWTHGVSCGPIW